MISKYIQANSQQGKRSDLEEGDTSVHGEQKLAGETKPKRPTTRDRFSKQLGISSPVFARYRCIAQLDEELLNVICTLLDEKRLGFMSAYRLSQLKPEALGTVVDLLKTDSQVIMKGSKVKQLCNACEESDSSLTREKIEELLRL